MREGNRLKLIRANYAAFNNGDIDGVMIPMHPEVEMIVADENGSVDPEQDFRGAIAVRSFFEAVKRDAGMSWVEVLAMHEVGSAVVSRVRIHGRVNGTGAEGFIPAVHRYTFEGDLIVRIETFRPEWRRIQGDPPAPA